MPKSEGYWIKVDGTDVKSALMESVNVVWRGDVDLGDGALQETRNQYDQRVALHGVPSHTQRAGTA